MKTLIVPVLIVSTSALAVTTFQYAQRAGVERKRADAAVVITEKQVARIRELEQSRGALEQQLTEAQRPAAIADKNAVVARGAPLAPVSLSGGGAVAALAHAEPNTVTNGFAVNPWSQRKQSPAAERYMRAQMRAHIRRQNEDVGTQLGLSPEQTSKLLDLIVAQQTPRMDNPRMTRDGVTLMQSMSDMQKRNAAEVAAVIGEDKLPQWQQYQKTFPERMQVDGIRSQLERMGTPITDDQRSRLVDLMVEQNQLNPRPLPQPGATPDELLQTQTKWQEEVDKVFADRARSVLTKEQYESYRDYQDFQAEMRSSFRVINSNAGQTEIAVLQSERAVQPAARVDR